MKQLMNHDHVLDRAKDEYLLALQYYYHQHDVPTKMMVLAGDFNDHVYAVNGVELKLTTPILIVHLEQMIQQLKES